MEIHNMEPADEYFVGTCTHTNESEEMDSSASRPAWLKIPRGISMNGREVYWGHEASRSGTRDAITQPSRL